MNSSSADFTPAAAGASSPLIAASTVILVRNAEGSESGRVETLMLQRVGRGAFAGMWVFPGGKVDPGDRVAIADIDLAHELAAARRAAVREAHEETGLIVDPAAMAALSHWMPPPTEARRFSTWFFVAPAPSGDVELALEEATAHQWVTPEDALTRNAEGSLPLAPPTWTTLHHISHADDVESLLRRLRLHTPPRMHTRVIATDPLTLAWAGDMAYEHADGEVDTDAPGPRHRLVLDRAGWRFVYS